MERTDIAVARFAHHTEAEAAVKTLAQAGYDMKQLSIVGRGYHTEEHPVGFYNAGGRIRFWGKLGAFWGALWGLFGVGIFLTSPATGPVMALGAVAAIIIGSVESAIGFAGASAMGAAIYSMGIPENSVLEYENTLKSNGFLVFVHGAAGDVNRAKTLLASVAPAHLDVHEGVSIPVTPEKTVLAAE
jgi:hypothetical protein